MLSKFVVNGKLNMKQKVSKPPTKLQTVLPDSSVNMKLTDVKLTLPPRPKLTIKRIESSKPEAKEDTKLTEQSKAKLMDEMF